MGRQDQKQQRKTVGVAFGSGGVRGIAHIGVLRAFIKHGIPIDLIAGTSVGAWMGAHYALFNDVELLENISLGKRKEKLHAMFELTVRGGLVKGNRIKKLVETWLGDPDFSDTRVPLSIVATDLVTGAAVVFDKGKIAPAVRASISVPSIFAPFDHEGMVLVDGGIANPVPADVVRAMGAEVVIAVNLDNFRRDESFSHRRAASLPAVSNRSMYLLRHYLAQMCCSSADVVIEPANASDELSQWRNYFLHDIGARHISLGEEAADGQMRKIKKLIWG
jgi:NTE family protein